MEPALHETLERCRRIEEQCLGSSGLLSPSVLASKAALPQTTVEALLRGETPEPEQVDDRVRSRLKALTQAHIQATGMTLPGFVSGIHDQLGISRRLVRKFLTGEEAPRLSLLSRLAAIFGVDGGAAFFTAPPAQALNRVLLAELNEPKRGATIEDIMRKHGVIHTDLRLHGTMAVDEFEQLIVTIIDSLPPTGDRQ